jgi:CHASE3 domain sensor protein
MSYQELFNVALGFISALGAWILSVVWDSIKDLQKDNKELTAKISEVEKLVAGDYVEKTYFDAKVEALFRKLDNIRDLLDKKVDK